MSPNPQRMTIEAFRDWAQRRPEGERWELVEGYPLRMMAGAKRSHRVVTNNIAVALTPAAKANGCDTATHDANVTTGPSSSRLPDIVVDCDPPDDDAMGTGRPVIIVEVASPGTRHVDQSDKLDEYRALDDARVVMLVEPDIVAVKLYRRDDTGEWRTERYGRLSDVVPLPEIGAALPVAVIYDTLSVDEWRDLSIVPPA